MNEVTLEDFYCNKVFVPPKEKHLETIFEEPRESKNGDPVLTSVKKYKRFLHFDPTEHKLRKRKRKASKCLKILKTDRTRVTRSSPDASNSDDVSTHILKMLDDSSSDSDSYLSSVAKKRKLLSAAVTSDFSGAHESSSSLDISDGFCGTPKLRCRQRRRSVILPDKNRVNLDTEESDMQIIPEKLEVSNEESDAVESPRRSCSIS